MGVDVLDVTRSQTGILEGSEHAATRSRRRLPRAGSCGMRRHSCHNPPLRHKSWPHEPWRARTLKEPSRLPPRPGRIHPDRDPRVGFAVAGSSFLAERARAAQKPPTPSGETSGFRTAGNHDIRIPVLDDTRSFAHRVGPGVTAVTRAIFGPLKPNMIDRLPEIMLMIDPGTKNGETCARHPQRNGLLVRISRGKPPDSGPDRHPGALKIDRIPIQPRIADGLEFRRHPEVDEGVHPPGLRRKVGANVESLDLAGDPNWKLEWDASNFVMLAIPERPAMMFDHPSSTVLPTGQMSPRPVMTTLRRAKTVHLNGWKGRPLGRPLPPGTRDGFFLVGRDVVHRLLDGRDLLGFLVGNLTLEFLF